MTEQHHHKFRYLLPPGTNFAFVAKFKTWFILSCLLMAVSLGAGPAVKVRDAGMLAHPAVKNWMADTAERASIPYQLEVLEGGSTDARAMQLVRGGVAAGCLSIPCRYIHTPSEMVDYRDVENAVKLLVEMLAKPCAL